MYVYTLFFLLFVFFFKQKTPYEMRISDWSSDVCSSDLYILKDDFDGLEIDGQQSISTYGDDYRPYLRLTAGKNFADNRGNIAINLEYSKTDPLLDYDRPWTALSPIAVTNPNDTGPNDGQPTQTNITPPHYRFHHHNAVPSRPRGPPPFFATFLADP